MFIQSLILTIIATLAPPDGPKDRDDDPDVSVIDDHFFCCATVEHIGGGSGEGCVKISEDFTKSCSSVLTCPGGYTDNDGVIHCTYPPES